MSHAKLRFVTEGGAQRGVSERGVRAREAGAKGLPTGELSILRERLRSPTQKLELQRPGILDVAAARWPRARRGLVCQQAQVVHQAVSGVARVGALDPPQPVEGNGQPLQDRAPRSRARSRSHQAIFELAHGASVVVGASEISEAALPPRVPEQRIREPVFRRRRALARGGARCSVPAPARRAQGFWGNRSIGEGELGQGSRHRVAALVPRKLRGRPGAHAGRREQQARANDMAAAHRVPWTKQAAWSLGSAAACLDAAGNP